MILKIVDEWKDPYTILNEFIENMRKGKGNPPETIDYNKLKADDKVTIEKKAD